RRLQRSAAGLVVARRRAAESLAQTGRAGLRRPCRRRRSARPLSPCRERRGRRTARCADGRSAVALRIPHHLPGRLRVRRGPAGGAVLFQRTWRSRSASSVNAASPVVIGDRIFISASYETGAALFRVQGNTLTEIWSQDEAMSNHYATSLVYNGTLYGFHGRQ